uniref:Uncharacterized protein n=1 Tax=viral metagenome TaxID=1070528 RepID=A0A6C0LS42_9ZZZZ
MSVCKITNDGINIVNNVDVDTLYKREEVVIQPPASSLRICIYTLDQPGTPVKQSTLLSYDLPPPFDNYLYNSPVYMQFIGGTITSVSQATQLIKLLGEIFVHTDDSVSDSNTLVYEKVEDVESEEEEEDDVPEEYYDHNEGSEYEEDEDVAYSDDDDDDESKVEDSSTVYEDDSSLK